jgi:phosphoglycolate phosphatase-like HAD superfamily hydrolase
MGGLHIVWDWNGTLLDDHRISLAATNKTFAGLGLPLMEAAEYQARFFAPVRQFFDSVTGRESSDSEWFDFDETFHRYYREGLSAARLAVDAERLLAGWRGTGGTQSLMSMYGDAQLQPLVESYGIRREFVRVDGRQRPSGGSKALEMADHLVRLREVDGLVVEPSQMVVIGDAADDGYAARHVGARAVLHTGGSQGRAALELTGYPVVESLTEAVALAAA